MAGRGVFVPTSFRKAIPDAHYRGREDKASRLFYVYIYTCMRKALAIISVFLVVCLWQGARSYALSSPLSDGVDSTGTGGNLPDMGWGDTANTTVIQDMQLHVDTAISYDLSGKAIKNNTKSIIIKNSKCRIIKR